MHDPMTDEEIGTIQNYGMVLRVFRRYESTPFQGPLRSLNGYVLEHPLYRGGEEVPVSVFIPRGSVDRLCALLQSDLLSLERQEFTHLKLKGGQGC